jgi:hypothetical protein
MLLDSNIIIYAYQREYRSFPSSSLGMPALQASACSLATENCSFSALSKITGDL